MNKINPKKLRNSKWTAVAPINKEKHFIVSKVTFDEDDHLISCHLEAVMTKRVSSINWRDLENNENWIQGWK